MSAVADLPGAPIVERPLIGRWLTAWSALHRRHAFAVVLATLMTSAINVGALADKLGRPGVGTFLLHSMFAGALLFTVSLLAWSAATAGQAPSGRTRVSKLVLAVLVSALLSAAIVIPSADALGIPEILWEMMGKSKQMPPLLLVILSETVKLSLISALFIVTAEVVTRRASLHAAVLASRREQASVARQVLESRLAAMQAQVEPQFLFNSLVAIEALYQKDANAAAENLDRLIQYLRVALPRLREPGSTISAELDLVRAYLAVVTSLHGGRPSLSVTVGDDCAGARFYPMLLLPLIQRAVREQDGRLPHSIRIGAQKVRDEVVIVTRIAQPGGCDEDFELARVRERLKGLYGERAALECTELDGGTTQFTLKIPASG